MKNSTKAAIATGAAAVLLLGGAGTLAYWNDTDVVDGGTLTAGDLDLNDVTCDADWVEDGDTITLLVPGDTVTKECTGTLTLSGEHIGATVDLDDTSVADAEDAFNIATTSGDAVDISAVLTEPAADITEPGTHDITVTITVDWPIGASVDNDAKGVSTSALDDLELEAVQTHDTTP